MCGSDFGLKVTRTLARLTDSSGGELFLLGLAHQGQTGLLLAPISAGASTIDPVVNNVGAPTIGYEWDAGFGSFSGNAMLAEGQSVHIAAETTKMPSHAVALRYTLGSVVKVTYEDTAMKTYLAVATSSGGAYFAGETVNGKIGVRRLNADGSVDTGFGSSGLAELDHVGAAGGVAVDSDGRVIVAATTSSNELFVVRLTKAGVPDATFNGGRINLPMRTSFEERIGMVIEPSGSVVVGGLVDEDGGAGPALVLARVEPDATVKTAKVRSTGPGTARTRVVLAREAACGYLYAAAPGGETKLWRVHW